MRSMQIPGLVLAVRSSAPIIDNMIMAVLVTNGSLFSYTRYVRYPEVIPVKATLYVLLLPFR